MRRTDREITDPEKIREIIDDCTCCRLGLCDEGKAYIVPLSFGYTEREGRKIDLIRAGGVVGFELDTYYKLNEAEQACGYSARFRSVIGTGTVSFVEGLAEKKAALERIMVHLTGKTGWDFPDEAVDSTCIFRLEAEELSCKEHL